MEEEEINPFRKKKGNPTDDFAILWDKCHKVELLATENKTNIEWLKKRFNYQTAIELSIVVLTVIGLLVKFKL